MFAKKSLGPDPRSKSIVEAEKGETVLTNKSRGLNNIVEMYHIGGKKHSNGGTPLDLPTDDEGTGASFIFSDKLKIEDKAVLEMFGAKGKSATFAEISKKHVSTINDSKKLLLDKESDDYTKKAAEKNIETSMVQLNKLKVLQESAKGFPNGMPSGTENYFKSMGVNPDELLAVNDDVQQAFQVAEQKAMGGIIKKRFLPMAVKGGELKWGQDNNARIQYDYIANTLSKDDKFKEALWQEYQNVLKEDDRFSSGYAKNKNAITRKDKNEVFNDYLDFQKRNLMLRSHGIDVKNTSQSPLKGQTSSKELAEIASKLNVDMPKMDDAAAQQLSFHAFENVVKNKDKYSEELKQVMQPFYANLTGKTGEKGVNDYEARGLSRADGAYTNTTAGEISLFDPQKIYKGVQTNPDLTFEEKDNNVQQVDTKGEKPGVSTQKAMLENPLGFRSQDIRNLNRSLASRASLRKYSPFMVSPELAVADAAYYSPERAIASVMEQVNSAEDVSKAFGDAQGATAGALALSGNAFSATADIIGNYADKNVGLFNNIASANAERASKQNAMDADVRTRLYADNVDMNEKFRRGVEMAKDKIVMMKNTAEKNMSDLYNLNRLNEQAKIDPLTGLAYITNEKDLKGTVQSDVDAMGEEFKSFRNTLPKDISNDLALKAFMGFKTGKIITDDATRQITPEEVQ